jgi:hypothetical protein
VGVNAISVRTKMSGLQRRVKIMAIPYKKDKALCSPTSALGRKRINVERGAEESYLCDMATETGAESPKWHIETE